MNIAIDGPAGAGKSTIARKLALKLGFVYVDTGAMYRSIALYMLRQDVELSDEAAVAGALSDLKITMNYEDGRQNMYLNGENVTDLIRSEDVSRMASKVSALGPVRAALLNLQRDVAAAGDTIIDGRDIGTTVLPDAEVKIYLTADPHVRAVRRYKEQTEKGEICNLESIEADIIERDYRDMHREISPLKQAEDAVVVDSSMMNINEVVSAIENVVKQKTAGGQN